MNGVIIIALNKQAYATSAFNLALSIKHYNPSIHITLLSDNIHQACYKLEHYAMFDSIKEIPKQDYTHEGRFCPAKAKLSMYKYTNYDKTLYLDADSICLKDIAPLFESLNGCEFKSNYVDGYTQWVHADTFKNFFGFEQGKTINSSWIYWEKTDVFEHALQYYNLGFPKGLLIQKWGNSLPDELFLRASVPIARLSTPVFRAGFEFPRNASRPIPTWLFFVCQ